MGKIYVGQSALRIRLTTSTDITGALTKQIKYEKPDGTTGSWDATVEDASTGIIYYDMVTGNEINQAGNWVFWAYIVFSDGRNAPGEPVDVVVYDQGE